MISFCAPNLLNNPDYQELNSLNLFITPIFKLVWDNYLIIAKTKQRVIGKPSFRLGTQEINVMGIRRNPEVSFNEKDYFYNDILIIQMSYSDEFYIFKVTMDPKGKVNKIAHLLEGIYASYNTLRPHRWVPGRTAIVQDRDAVIVARTDSTGKVIIKEKSGIFGINIHDSDKYLNSSMGCTVLEPESALNQYQFAQHFKPLIKSIFNKDSVDYTVINIDLLKSILKSVKDKIEIPTSIFKMAFNANNIINKLMV